MSGSSFGTLFKISTWGESHGEGVGVVVDGCPAGLPLKEADIQKELDRRKTGQSKVTTMRKETDCVRILSGIFKGKTTGTPIALWVENQDADSSKYEDIKNLFRPPPFRLSSTASSTVILCMPHAPTPGSSFSSSVLL